MRQLLIASLLGSLLLTSCGSPDAEISFAEPLPIAGRELAHFRARHQGVYVALNDRQDTVRITATAVIHTAPDTTQPAQDSTLAPASEPTTTLVQPGAQLRAGPVETHQLEDARPVARPAAMPAQPPLRAQLTDTLFVLGPATRLRQSAPAYYLSQANPGEGTWQVRRLRLRGRQLWWEEVETDTVRLRELLPPALLNVVRAERRVWPLFLLRPTAATQQQAVLSNSGLWQGREYVRVARPGKSRPEK